MLVPVVEAEGVWPEPDLVDVELALTRVGLLAPQGLFALHADWQPESPLQFVTQPPTSRVHVKYGIV